MRPLWVPEDDFPDYEDFNAPCVIDGQVYTLNNVSIVPKESHSFSSILVGKEKVTVPSQCIYMAFMACTP
jgi:hypothetical protein